MAIIAVSWVILSMGVCLALLRAAARPLPYCESKAAGRAEAAETGEPGYVGVEMETTRHHQATAATLVTG